MSEVLLVLASVLLMSGADVSTEEKKCFNLENIIIDGNLTPIKGVCLNDTNFVNIEDLSFIESEVRPMETRKIKINVDNEMIEVESILYNDYNFIKLRDLNQSDNITVEWDENNRIVKVNTHAKEKIVLTEREKDLLKKLMWAEARGQGADGELLVANVVMNRVKSSQFPNTIEGVIYQPQQFSVLSDGQYASATPGEREEEALARLIAGEDNSQGAVFFATKAAVERSSFFKKLTYLFTDQNHMFFK